MERPKTTDEFTKFLQSVYSPKADVVQELTLPKLKFLSVTGQGAPESEAFMNAIQEMYGAAYGLKMGLSHGKLPQPSGYFDYKVAALEGLWWQEDGVFDMNDRDHWHWQLLIMVPDFVDQALTQVAKDQAKAKHPEIAYEQVELIDFEEGRVIQMMHIGPYATEPVTLAKLDAYKEAHGLKMNGKHHEIYLGDPRRAEQEKLKTILRHPVA